jgi:predicted O-methyltransferase YrrM
MKIDEALRGAAAMNLCGLHLALTRRSGIRGYLSECLRRYEEIASIGLPHRDPLELLRERGWGAFTPDQRVVLPTRTENRGGVQLDELVILATATRMLEPRKIFEIGTYNGSTTSVLVMNAPPDAEILTLDLPPEPPREGDFTRFDLDLIATRQVGACLRELGLADRCQQILCDSLAFDPELHRGTVELGFIDGAHTLRFVENDTRKMAVMMAERGLVFWHDYGGQGAVRPLAKYLESLAGRIPLYCVHGTSLAWTSAPDLRRLLGADGAAGAP